MADVDGGRYRDIARQLQDNFGLPGDGIDDIDTLPKLQQLLAHHRFELAPDGGDLVVKGAATRIPAVDLYPLDERQVSPLLELVKSKCGAPDKIPAFLNAAAADPAAGVKRAKALAGFMKLSPANLAELERKGKVGQFLQAIADGGGDSNDVAQRLIGEPDIGVEGVDARATAAAHGTGATPGFTPIPLDMNVTDGAGWRGETVNIDRLTKLDTQARLDQIQRVCGLDEKGVKDLIKAQLPPKSKNPIKKLMRKQQKNRAMKCIVGAMQSVEHSDGRAYLRDSEKLKQLIKVAITLSIISKCHNIYIYKSPKDSLNTDPAMRHYVHSLTTEFKNSPTAMQAIGSAHMIIQCSSGLSENEKKHFRDALGEVIAELGNDKDFKIPGDTFDLTAELLARVKEKQKELAKQLVIPKLIVAQETEPPITLDKLVKVQRQLLALGRNVEIFTNARETPKNRALAYLKFNKILEKLPKTPSAAITLARRNPYNKLMGLCEEASKFKESNTEGGFNAIESEINEIYRPIRHLPTKIKFKRAVKNEVKELGL